MTRNETRIDFAEERDRLDAKLDELAEVVAETDEESVEHEEAVMEANQIESQFLPGLHWASEEFDDSTVRIGGLTTGERGRVLDRVRAAQRQQVGFDPAEGPPEGLATPFWCAAGIEEAPFLDGHEFETKVRAVRSLPPQFTAWLEHRIDDLTTLDHDTGNSFAARVEAKKRRSGRDSSTPEQS
ncbi:hypothetical protein [Halorussus sp. MSC15.2]|uniref:hypothetical protein n=1 Tax=Halorussus sp. MSC15.2 TaxID=2283638 RepID=UPI0013D42C20|nr:hypothetical protein [Halorussus sp. MSC15.2]NEU57101.1 hypothetical protein [Halorussus sp. MSC15.2]